MFILIVMVFALAACNHSPKAKIYSCQEYSLSCELQKDRVLVLPIIYDSNIIDACGYRMSDLMNKNQWYVVSTKSHGLVPVGVYICLRLHHDLGCVESTFTPTPQQLLSSLRQDDKIIKIDTTDLSSLVPGLTKAAIIVSGPNEIVYSNLASPTLAEPK